MKAMNLPIVVWLAACLAAIVITAGIQTAARGQVMVFAQPPMAAPVPYAGPLPYGPPSGEMLYRPYWAPIQYPTPLRDCLFGRWRVRYQPIYVPYPNRGNNALPQTSPLPAAAQPAAPGFVSPGPAAGR